MKRRVKQVAAIALTVVAVNPVLSQEGPMDPESEDSPGMHGMQTGQDMMQGGMGQHHGMMQMMMHCMSMMEQMHGEGAHEHEGMGDMNGMGGMNGMGMPGMMEGDQAAGGFDVATAEALARAFVRGRSGDEVGSVEILGVTNEDGRFLVEYRQGSTQGTVIVDAETGEVTEEDDR